MISPRTDNRATPVAKTQCSSISVIFDLDGTLLDSVEDMTDAVNTVLKQRGYPTRSIDEVKLFLGEGPETFAKGALPCEAHQPAIIASLIEEYRAEYAKIWTRKTHPYPGIVELLNILGKRGVSMAILSNKRDAVVKEAVAYFFPDVPFAQICGAIPEIPLKPDAGEALRMAEYLRSAPACVLFVGDTKTDMQTACSAGMIAVGALWGFRTAKELSRYGAKHLVEHPLDILDIPEWKEMTDDV